MYIVNIQNIFNLQSLVASEEVATFEVAQLQDPLGTSVWRSTGLTPNIVGQFDESRTIDAWGALYSNAQVGDQDRLRLATSEANLIAAPVVDTGLVNVRPGTGDLSGWPHIHQREIIASPAAATWFRIDFDFTGNTDGFVQFGALPLDARFEPVLGHASGWELIPRASATFANLLADGSIGKGGGIHKRDARFTLVSLSRDEAYGEFRDILRQTNETLPVLVVLDEDDDVYPMDSMFYGYMTARRQTEPMPNTAGHFVVPGITIQEP